MDRASGEVRVEARVAADRGWLEQAVCAAGTRDHESLLAVRVRPSTLHAALLVLGAEPGRPGSWLQRADGTVVREAPTGDELELDVRFAGGTVPLSDWIRDPSGMREFPRQPWVFSGSRIDVPVVGRAPDLPYAADRSGSVAGIVTFGDETIACSEVIADRAEVDSPSWEARTERMPAPGTRVTLVIRRRRPGAEVAP